MKLCGIDLRNDPETKDLGLTEEMIASLEALDTPIYLAMFIDGIMDDPMFEEATPKERMCACVLSAIMESAKIESPSKESFLTLVGTIYDSMMEFRQIREGNTASLAKTPQVQRG